MNTRYERPQPEHRVRKKSSAKFFIAIALILIILAVSNPGSGDFAEYAMNHMEDSFGIEFSESVSNLIGQPVLESLTRRSNYILFSVFSIPDVKDSATFIGDIQATKKFLGLFKIFFIEL
jgi:hypothetical protein